MTEISKKNLRTIEEKFDLLHPSLYRVWLEAVSPLTDYTLRVINDMVERENWEALISGIFVWGPDYIFWSEIRDSVHSRWDALAHERISRVWRAFAKYKPEENGTPLKEAQETLLI